MTPDVIKKCWDNILSPLDPDDDEDDIPLSVLRLRIRKEEMAVARSDDADLLHHVNPDVEIKGIDIDEWNNDDVPDMDETEILVESDEDSDVQQDTGLVNNNLRVTTSNALKSLNQVIQWTEENPNRVDYSSVLVLHNLRHVMVQMGLTQQHKQTKITFLKKKKLN